MKTEVSARKIKLRLLHVESISKYTDYCVSYCANRDQAVEYIVAYLKALYGDKTPDHAPINKTNVRHALRNWPKS